jgi:hypothetical protein
MHEKLAKGGPKESPAVLKKALDQSWKDLQTALTKGSKVPSEHALGGFLLALTALANAKGLHAEMALRQASSELEKRHQPYR